MVNIYIVNIYCFISVVSSFQNALLWGLYDSLILSVHLSGPLEGSAFVVCVFGLLYRQFESAVTNIELTTHTHICVYLLSTINERILRFNTKISGTKGDENPANPDDDEMDSLVEHSVVVDAANALAFVVWVVVVE